VYSWYSEIIRIFRFRKILTDLYMQLSSSSSSGGGGNSFGISGGGSSSSSGGGGSVVYRKIRE
jgi:uncharacterized membrane protein YgcG